MRFCVTDYTPEDKVVMRCRTLDQALVFLECLDNAGLTWCNGNSYIDEHEWHHYLGATCYGFLTGEYCGVDWYVSDGWKILEFEDFDWNNDNFNGTPEVVLPFAELFK